MNKNEIIEMVGKLLKFASTDQPSAVEPTKEQNTITDKDGVMYVTTAEKWDVGVDIMKVDNDGKQEDVKDGDIYLADGTMLSIKGGKVDVVTPAKETTVEEVEEAKQEMSQDFSKELSSRDAKLQELEEKFTKVMDITSKLYEFMKELPAGESIKLTPTETSEEFSKKPSNLSKREKNLLEMREVMEEYKNEKNKK